MCGRYVLVSKLSLIEKRFNASTIFPELYKKSPNVSLGDLAPIVCNDNPNKLQMASFGFSPSWSDKRMYLFNARLEGDNNKENSLNYHGAFGIAQKPAFRKAIRQQRCLIPADAYIEGPEKEKLSKPFVVFKSDAGNPFAFAGIWEDWLDKSNGEIVRTFGIITTWANNISQKIGHHRAPLVLMPQAEYTWLASDLSLEQILTVLRNPDNDNWNAYPISDAVKNQKNKDLTLLTPSGNPLLSEYEYHLYQELKLEGMGNSQSRARKQNEL